jgi:hypothetical protein
MVTTIVGTEGGSGAWNELEADVYDATLTAVEDGGVSSYPPNKPQYKFTFTLDLTDDEGENIRMYNWPNQVLSPKSNVAGIIDACGKTWTPGQTFDLDSLVGSRCRVLINIREKTNKRFVADVLSIKAVGQMAKPKASTDDTAAVSETCGFPKCGQQAIQYDEDGMGICVKHGGIA